MTQLTHANHSMPAERSLVENVFTVLGILRRGWRFIVISVLVCATMGAIYVARVNPVYKGSARLLIIQEGGAPAPRRGRQRPRPVPTRRPERRHPHAHAHY